MLLNDCQLCLVFPTGCFPTGCLGMVPSLVYIKIDAPFVSMHPCFTFSLAECLVHAASYERARAYTRLLASLHRARA